jgi:SMODS and SLOG-associating 2TM effector domain 1
MTSRAAQFRALYRELRITDQEQYYQDRAREYGAAHRQAIAVRNLLLIASALIGIGGQFLSGTGRAGLSVIAAVLAALAGAVTAFEALIGFPQLSKLYNDAALNLAAAGLDWEPPEPEGDLAEALDRVEQVFRAEHGQWGQLAVKDAGDSGAGSGG